MLALLAWGITHLSGCYAHTCAANDTSCLPCPDVRSTNPTCVPPLNDDNVIPLDAKRHDGGTDR